jgi:tyrosyl-tRNA synthetase
VLHTESRDFKIPTAYQSENIMEKIGVDIAELLVTVGFAKTKSEARRHIKGGAIRIQNNKVHDPFARLALSGNVVIVIEEK